MTDHSLLSRDREAFLSEVRCRLPDAVDTYAEILDDFIEWSRSKYGKLEFVPRDGDQAIVKFCVPGIGTPFWAAYPRAGDGAKMTVFPERLAAVPESVRETLRKRFGEIQHQEVVPNGQPILSFRSLQDRTVRDDVKRLLSEVLDQVHPVA